MDAMLDTYKSALASTLVEVNIMIDHVKRRASATATNEYAMMNSDGTLVLAPLLLAKSNLLLAIEGTTRPR